MCELTPVGGSSFSEHRIAAPRPSASHHRHMRALTCHATSPLATSLFVSGTTTTALHASKAASPCCKRRCAFVQLRTDRCLLRLSPRLSTPEATLFRKIRKLRSPISIPRTFSTSTQAQSASCTIHVPVMFVTCSFRSQSISSHETQCSEVSNAHLCRKLAQPDWLILEVIVLRLAANAILA